MAGCLDEIELEFASDCWTVRVNFFESQSDYNSFDLNPLGVVMSLKPLCFKMVELLRLEPACSSSW